MEISVSMTVSSRHYFSISHLFSAALFAKHCKEVEANPEASMFNTLGTTHRAYAMSTVISSVAFLEATINELFADCENGHHRDRINALQSMELMEYLWKEPCIEKAQALNKYEIALKLNYKTAIDRGDKIHQDAKLLFELRNALIHYKPETIVGYSDYKDYECHKFEKGFANRKFSLNPLAGAGDSFYPVKILGAGCACWAVGAAVAFTDDFFLKLGIPAIYDNPARPEWLVELIGTKR
jgi:hypothetical protein